MTVHDDRLIAYVACPDPDVEGVLRAATARRLPTYMQPDTWILLPHMPLTTSGKIDRRALPAPVRETSEVVPPGSDTERSIAATVADVLSLQVVSVVDSFFDIGGHSLSATRVTARLAHEFAMPLTVRDLFEFPTVRLLAGHIDATRDRLDSVEVSDGARAARTLGRIPRPARLPLSPAQQRMWFLNQFDPASPTYNIPFALRVGGDLDLGALRAALGDVLERHEILRTRYPRDVDGRPWQAIVAADEITPDQWWWTDDVEGLPMSSFDVTVDLPIRAGVVAETAHSHVVIVVCHHIAFDGESIAPFLRDLIGAYAARGDGRQPSFAPLPVQYADVSLWRSEMLGAVDDADSEMGRQVAWWRQRLADLPEVLELPTDRPRPAVASGRGAVTDIDIPVDLVPALDEYARRTGVTVFMVVHAAVAVVLSRLAGATDIALGTPVSGRGRAELDGVVGMFVNTLVLRTEIDPSAAFDDVVRTVRDGDLDAFAAADVPFEHLVDVLTASRSEAFAPLTQVLVTVEQSGVGVPDLAGLDITPVDPGGASARFDLTIGVTADRDGDGALCALGGRIVYATDLFDEPTVTRIGQRIVDVLAVGIRDPRVVVGDIELAADSEKAAVAGWSVGGAAVGVEVFGAAVSDAGVSDVGLVVDSVAAVVAGRVGVSPGAVAVRFGDRVVSYGEFGARVEELARHLIGLGVGPDVAVGVRIPRSVELLVAIHAVVAAGGRYVPVEMDTPAERVEYMFATAGVEIVLEGPGDEVGDTPAGVMSVMVDCGGPVPASVSGGLAELVAEVGVGEA
ncbi:condensation domain-containing protein, partial [Gordonia soli]|uniref:condensation domain-containing protein n=1 Tax=Gordonia soli TaxID=320799 RepID=UPI0012FBAF43